ncbi:MULTISPECIES: hypothetical protein [Gammaproteobacteria]|uniref:Uncharacterized protein n=1 Tax=Vibrio casei TaxID=673372 RepID=A0A368LFW3_9VIBR|nr:MULTISPECIES: hypothetical protein [Gammaproteobacteria]MCK8103072.1 hypothetical protein [Pseudoalteromonas sp. 2CM36K]RCS68689.1 hypothetical protein CIK83_17415 [Vibrio casei]
MTSIPATELAKLGKCEKLIKPSPRSHTSSSFKFKRKENTNQSSIDRGNAAHDQFEREAIFFTKIDYNNQSTIPNLIVTVSFAVGLLVLLIKVFM